MDSTHTPTRPGTTAQLLGFLLGLVAGLLLCAAAFWLLATLVEQPRTPLTRMFFGLIGLIQFGWLIPLAWLGWRKRNVGFIVGVLLASAPLILLNYACFYPAWRDEGLRF